MSKVAVAVLALFAVSGAWGASGSINIRARDVETGYGIRATLTLEGPESLKLQTDGFGRVRRDIPVGRYLYTISAQGYEEARSHLQVNPGSNLPGAVMMKPEVLPEELRDLDDRVRPGYSLVYGFVVDAETCRPVAGVRVHSEVTGVEGKTDSRGYFSVYLPLSSIPAHSRPNWMCDRFPLIENVGIIQH